MDNISEWQGGEGAESEAEMQEKRLWYNHLQKIIEEELFIDNQKQIYNDRENLLSEKF